MFITTSSYSCEIFVIGSEIYQETLTKALAKDLGAKILIVDSLLLPGVSFLDIFRIYTFVLCM